jgi:hypothetical protein
MLLRSNVRAHNFLQLNRKSSEEDRYYYHKKDNLNLPEKFEWKK